jgi:hypothetical protein
MPRCLLHTYPVSLEAPMGSVGLCNACCISSFYRRWFSTQCTTLPSTAATVVCACVGIDSKLDRQTSSILLALVGVVVCMCPLL